MYSVFIRSSYACFTGTFAECSAYVRERGLFGAEILPCE